MKKLSTLLSRRLALLHEARLANLAFAYTTLRNFSARISRAQLSGHATFKSPAPHGERYLASLTAWDSSQSVIEEHFTDEDLMEVADVLTFVTGTDPVDITFALEDFEDLFLIPLREELDREGVTIDRPMPQLEEPYRQG
jgi:hypothetical protein